jgi:hypothetical protein
MGIEPTAQAWEAWVLPLYDARIPWILVALRPINQCLWHQRPSNGTPPRAAAAQKRPAGHFRRGNRGNGA